jgi:hypothetical protein
VRSTSLAVVVCSSFRWSPGVCETRSGLKTSTALGSVFASFSRLDAGGHGKRKGTRQSSQTSVSWILVVVANGTVDICHGVDWGAILLYIIGI